jgi:hypothetical protein
VRWVSEGHWTNIYDYGLGIWWEKGNNPLKESIEKNDPHILEAALRGYHDRVLTAGSSLYAPVPKMKSDDQQQFVEALLATSGDVVCYCDSADQISGPAKGAVPLLKDESQPPCALP